LLEPSNPSNRIIVLPYVSSRERVTELRSQRRVTTEGFEGDQTTVQLYNILRCLHAINVYHCDIKPGNFIIKEDGLPLIIDFSTMIKGDHIDIGDPNTFIPHTTTSNYVSPYLIHLKDRVGRGEDITKDDIQETLLANDRWAFSVTRFEMAIHNANQMRAGGPVATVGIVNYIKTDFKHNGRLNDGFIRSVLGRSLGEYLSRPDVYDYLGILVQKSSPPGVIKWFNENFKLKPETALEYNQGWESHNAIDGGLTGGNMKKKRKKKKRNKTKRKKTKRKKTKRKNKKRKKTKRKKSKTKRKRR